LEVTFEKLRHSEFCFLLFQISSWIVNPFSFLRIIINPSDVPAGGTGGIPE